MIRKPFDATEAIKKSIETAKNEYPDGEIKSTKMVVYDYTCVGAMTVVKDKTTGDEYRIFVDVYTLDVVPDEPATETKRGIWSIYERRLKNGIDNNLKQWQKSDELTKSIEQAATDKGVNINVPVTEENIKKLRDNSTVAATNVQSNVFSPAYQVTKTLSVPLSGQTTLYYCQPASAQMISSYYGVSHTQDYIYNMMGPYDSNGGVWPSNAVHYYTSSNGLNKSYSSTTTSIYWSTVLGEINSGRPFVSDTTTHARVCCGYQDNGYLTNYLFINDPMPPYIGNQYWEVYGNEASRIYVKS